RRETTFPKHLADWVVSGPHFFVCTPLYKTPNEGCSTNRDYSDIDLLSIAPDYLPRTNYLPACSPSEYRKRMPQWKGKPIVSFFRVITRKMVNPTNERTLIATVIPPGPAHIDGCFSVALESEVDVLFLGWLWGSIPYDFWVKTTGKSNFRQELAELSP